MKLISFLFSIIFLQIFSIDLIFSKKNVLIFGGNGFLGGETVVQLLQKEVDIYLINRGNWYWDSLTRIKPFVKHINCNRYVELGNCSDFINISHNISSFDIVIDFSLFSQEGLTAVLPFLKDRIGLYIYISTAGIYEICKIDHDNPIKEQDGDCENIDKPSLNTAKRYAFNKLECENILKKQRAKGGFPFVILRLPDVIGPRDSSRRWWIYQLWMEYSKAIKRPIILAPGWKEKQVRPVYVKDVAKVIVDIIDTGESVYDETFHLALEEILYIKEMLVDLRIELGASPLKFQTLDTHIFYSPFPSTMETQSSYNIQYNSLYTRSSKGILNFEKAKKLLNFQPTSWKVALKETAEFYRSAFSQFLDERNEVLLLIFNDIVPKKYKEIMLSILSKLNENENLSKKDEL